MINWLKNLFSKRKENKTMVPFTRVYKFKDSSEVRTQPISVNPEFIVSVRPSNRLDTQRSVITMVDGTTYDLLDSYKEVKAVL